MDKIKNVQDLINCEYYLEEVIFEIMFLAEGYNEQQNYIINPTQDYLVRLRLTDRIYDANYEHIGRMFTIHKSLMDEVACRSNRKKRFKETIIPDLISAAMSPARMMKQIAMFDDIEDFFNNI